MVERSADAVDQRLGQLRREADREWRQAVATAERDRRRATRPERSLGERVGLFVVTVVVLGALPFAALVRGSVYLHHARGLPASLALAAGLLATAALVAAYAAWLLHRVSGRLLLRPVLQWFALPLAAFYGLYALVYVSSANLKQPELRASYSALHPLLRVALATLILVDRDLVLTDLARTPADYARMGLPAQEASRHYRQADGWVHAVDLRTAGRGAVVNGLVQVYFRAMGFATLRHVGTEDHLHVALPAPG